MESMINATMSTEIILTNLAEKVIKKTLESVFAQTYKNIEIVLVDDPEPDGTPLRFVDIPGMVEKNKDIIEKLVEARKAGEEKVLEKNKAIEEKFNA